MVLQVQLCDLSSENIRCGQFNLQLTGSGRPGAGEPVILSFLFLLL